MLENKEQMENLEERIRKRVGARLRELRKASGVTTVNLAMQTGVSQGQLSKIENGKATLSVAMLTRLCQIFNRPLGYLFQSFEEMPRVLGTLTTVKGPEHIGIQWFAEEVRRRSEGSLTLIPLSPSQIGMPLAQVDQLSAGYIDMFVEEPVYYSSYVPGFSVFELPYLFRSESHRNAFLGSSFFQERLIEPLSRNGIRFVNRRWNWVRGIEWVIAAKRPVVAPSDLRGLKIRTTDSPVMHRFWKMLGARPVPVPWAEVGAALRAGDIDALPTHKAHLYPLEFCRHLRFVTLLGDLPPVLGVAINESKYRILTPDIQTALIEACDQAGAYFSRHVSQSEPANEALNISRFKAAYIKVSLDPWRDASNHLRGELIGEGLLDSDTVTAVDKALFDHGD